MPPTAIFLRSAGLACSIVLAAVFFTLESGNRPADRNTNPPELRAKDHVLSLTLHAGIASDGKSSFFFNGQPKAPTLRLFPGDQLKITYVNDLPAKSPEKCLAGLCKLHKCEYLAP